MPLVRDLSTLLRFPGFRRLLTVRLLSQLADGVYQVGLATYVVFSPEQQASPGAIAAALAILLLPYSLLGPFAGVLLDRWRRRQVLLFGNLLRAVLAAGTTILVLLSVPTWLFYLSALSVTAVNRFVLAGLSASLPRVVDGERLIMANSLSPTAGTIATTLGSALAFLVRLLTRGTTASDAVAVGTGAVVYLLAGLAALRMGRDLLGPDPSQVQPSVRSALAGTARGLVEGLRHLAGRRAAAGVLTAMSLMRFGYGALTVMVLMLSRYAWGDSPATGLKWLGLAFVVSGIGFFAAAVVTPWGLPLTGWQLWVALCAGAAALLVPALVLPFAPVPMLAAAAVLGLCTQSTKITTDTTVQATVDDAYRGRVFALYDMLFNVAFVGAAGVAAVLLPADGRSVPLVLTVTFLYAAVAVAMTTAGRRFT
ncbi:MAG TPA: MFS transporter [Streptomyces sp.]|nr:MFS transporter [Streptomyces sp.]